MGEATTGRTLTAELCFKLFLELKRGKRLFLMLGFLPSSMSVCGAQKYQSFQHHQENGKLRLAWSFFYISVKKMMNFCWLYNHKLTLIYEKMFMSYYCY